MELHSNAWQLYGKWGNGGTLGLRHCMALHGTAWHCMALHGTALAPRGDGMIRHATWNGTTTPGNYYAVRIVLQSTALYYREPARYATVRQRTARHGTVRQCMARSTLYGLYYMALHGTTRCDYVRLYGYCTAYCKALFYLRHLRHGTYIAVHGSVVKT
jgi:hypothetical protein